MLTSLFVQPKIPMGDHQTLGDFPARELLQAWVCDLHTPSFNTSHSLQPGPPPGMAAPGTAPPPGMAQSNSQQPGRPGGFPPNFQPPANMPNINFSAPVIRLGTSGPQKPGLGAQPNERGGDSRRAGLGAGQNSESQRQALRESLMSLQPPSKEEVLRTIFVGGITEGCGGDEGIERILRSAGNLRRWTRATDADNKACKFGFAEYEDPESLSTAIEVLRDVEVPVKRQTPHGDDVKENGEVEKSKLLVCPLFFS
jgi:hypothetical protein